VETHSTEHILSTIAESLGCALSDVKPWEKLIDLADSMETAQLVLDLELEFGIEVPDDELRHLFTVQDVINYVNTHSAAVRHS
jgi:acyl carrier protein